MSIIPVNVRMKLGESKNEAKISKPNIEIQKQDHSYKAVQKSIF